MMISTTMRLMGRLDSEGRADGGGLFRPACGAGLRTGGLRGGGEQRWVGLSWGIAEIIILPNEAILQARGEGLNGRIFQRRSRLVKVSQGWGIRIKVRTAF